MSMRFLLMLSLLSILPSTPRPEDQPKERPIINSELAFSSISDVTLIFLASKNILNMRRSLRSFFYYNTQPIYQIIIVDPYQTSKLELWAALPENVKMYEQHIETIQADAGIAQALTSAFQSVKTHYILFYTGNWIATGGMGFAQQAIDIFKHAHEHDLTISQVTPFPPGKSSGRLGRMIKTSAGAKFHKVTLFDQQQGSCLAFVPSLFQLSPLLKQILAKYSMACQSISCIQQRVGKELQTGHGYYQVYINDDNPNPPAKLLEQNWQ